MRLFTEPNNKIILKSNEISKVLPDVHYEKPEISIPINLTGLTDVYKWIRLNIENESVILLVKFDAFVDLPEDMRGFNISRSNEAINEIVNYIAKNSSKFLINTIPRIIAEKILEKHEYSASALVDMSLTYPYAAKTLMGYPTQEKCFLQVSSSIKRKNDSTNLDYNKVSVEALGAIACPLAKAMVRDFYFNQHKNAPLKNENDIPFGTHTEKTTCRVEFTFFKDVYADIEEILNIIEKSLRTPLREMMKRPDELFTLKKMLESPQFIEDCVRRCVFEIVENFSDLPNNTQIQISQNSSFTFSPYNIRAIKKGTLSQFKKEIKENKRGDYNEKK